MYYVYLILCEDNSIYTGITNNLERRFKEHSEGKGGHYTSRGVVQFLHSEKVKTRSRALKREAEIKSWPREKKLNLVKFGCP